MADDAHSRVLKVWAEWKRDCDRSGHFYETGSHSCRRKEDGKPTGCQMIRLPLFDCGNGELSLVPRPVVPKPVLSKPSPANKTAVGQPQEFTALKLYVCKVSGHPHVCSYTGCDAVVLTDDGNRVCMLTGTVLEQHNSNYYLYGTVDNWFEARRVSRNTARDALEESVAVELPKMRRNIRKQDKRSYLAHAMVAITSLLSPERFREDFAFHSRRTAVIRELLERYIARCHNKRVFPDVIVMAQMAARERARLQPLVVLHMDTETLRNLSAIYANAVLSLWYVLRTRLRDVGGDSLTYPPNFSRFVVATMELMQSGVELGAQEGYNVEVIHKDPILSVVPMTNAAQGLVLKQAKNLKVMRKSIVATLKAGVTELGMAPEELAISQYVYKNMDDDVFRIE